MTMSKTSEILLHRRQFLLGPAKHQPNQFWSHQELQQGLILSLHLDLVRTIRVSGSRTLALLGHAIDARDPGLVETDIADLILRSTSDLSGVIEATKPLAGRWLIVYQDRSASYLFSDPCGLRQVYYCYVDGEFWAGSQPEIIREHAAFECSDDALLLEFVNHPQFSASESVWIGDGTIYTACRRLMPNHYLDVQACSQLRFYPCGELQAGHPASVIESTAELLENILLAITQRYPAKLALTAGWGSRVLLAASRSCHEQIEYFVDRMGLLGLNHPDVRVPLKLSKKLDIDFRIENSAADLPGWFQNLQSKNISMPRTLPKSRVIYSNLLAGRTAVNINGNASEICRNYFEKSGTNREKTLQAKDLVGLGGYPATEFAVAETDKWLQQLRLRPSEGFDLLDLFYWEQTMGNWGAQFPAEQDIAIDEISPFNCRLIIENLLCTDSKLRTSPDYKIYAEIIRVLWPEVLALPINPAPATSRIANSVHRLLHIPHS